MAVEDPPGVLDGDTTPSEVQRHTTQGLLGVPVGAFAGGVGATSGGGHGVCGSGDLLVTQSASVGMSVDVAKGIAFVVGTVSAAQGPYSFYNNATVTLTISQAHATLARQDLIVAQIQDATYSGAVRSARLLVVAGTPGSGTDPSLSGTPNALVLARVTVPAAATNILTAHITDLRTYAYAIQRAGYAANGSAWTPGTSFSAITGASLLLPAGAWAVQGKFFLAASTGAVRTTTLELWNATAATQLDASEQSGPVTTSSVSMQVQRHVTLTATSTIQLRAKVSAVDGTQSHGNSRIWATPVGMWL